MPPKIIIVIGRKIKIRDEGHFKEWRKEEGVKSLLDTDDIEISDLESLENGGTYTLGPPIQQLHRQIADLVQQNRVLALQNEVMKLHRPVLQQAIDEKVRQAVHQAFLQVRATRGENIALHQPPVQRNTAQAQSTTAQPPLERRSPLPRHATWTIHCETSPVTEKYKFQFKRSSLRFAPLKSEADGHRLKLTRLYEIVNNVVVIGGSMNNDADATNMEKFNAARPLFKQKATFSKFLNKVAHCILVCHRNDLDQFSETYLSRSETAMISMTKKGFKCICGHEP